MSERKKEMNCHDRYKVVITENRRIVGHLPQEYSKLIYSFIRNGGCETGEVFDKKAVYCIYEKVGIYCMCVYYIHTVALCHT